MKIINQTVLPDRVVEKVLWSSLRAVVATIEFGDRVQTPLGALTVLVREGETSGLASTIATDTEVIGFYVEMLWAVNHQNRMNSWGRFDRAYDLLNALDIYSLCAHEIGHCVDDLITGDVGVKGGRPPTDRSPEEVSAREHSRRVERNLNLEQLHVVQELALECEFHGDPGKRKSRARLSRDKKYRGFLSRCGRLWESPFGEGGQRPS